jgi:hypothetical protein
MPHHFLLEVRMSHGVLDDRSIVESRRSSHSSGDRAALCGHVPDRPAPGSDQSHPRMTSTARAPAWIGCSGVGVCRLEEAGPREVSRRRQGQPISHPHEEAEGHRATVLYQLPPRWDVDLERLVTFVRSLPRRRQHAIEFRRSEVVRGRGLQAARSAPRRMLYPRHGGLGKQ